MTTEQHEAARREAELDALVTALSEVTARAIIDFFNQQRTAGNRAGATGLVGAVCA